ncbi:hypothetical protein GCM10022204_43110 [Microlunatus aurantiacus]|uniref:Polysaccharide transporter, PST family n=1 Tax=Microlunatus aurantiacus TaxID=446786 RepID=A0ABP7EHK1_9ACTN
MRARGFLRDLRRLTGDASLVSFGQIVSYAYPLVSIPLLSRVLGIEGLGMFIATLAVLQMLVAWTDFGFGFSALRRMAVAKDDAGRESVAAATLTAKLGLWAIGSVFLMIIVFSVPSLRPHWGLFLIGVLTTIGVALYPMWYLQAVGRLKLLAFLTAGARLVALAGLVLTVHGVDQVGLAVFWQFLPYPLSALVCWFVIRRAPDIRLRLTRPAPAREALRDSVPLFVNMISGQLIVNSSAILLAQLGSYRQVGLFGPADRLTSAIHGVLVSVEQAMLPRVSDAHERPDQPNQRRLILIGLVLCYSISGLTLTVTAPVIIPWYLGDQFVEAVPIVQVMGVATVLSGVARTLVLDLVSAGRTKPPSVVTSLAVGWHIITAGIAAWLWGAIGVAFAVCGTQLFMATGLWIATARGRRRQGQGDTAAPASERPRVGKEIQ